MLWKDICQNQLLAKTTLILFLNKVRFSVLLVLYSPDTFRIGHVAGTQNKLQ